MVLSISSVVLLIGLGLIVYGWSADRSGVMFSGVLIALLAIWIGFFIIGTTAPELTQVTKLNSTEIEILRSPTAVHIRTTDGQLSRTYTELLHYITITDTTAFYQVEQFNSYGTSIKQYIKY